MKQFPASPTPNQIFENWMWDDVKNRWVPVGHHWSPPEAPVDGDTYGRRDGEWEQVLPIEGGVITGHLTVGSTLAAGVTAFEVARDSIFHGKVTMPYPADPTDAATKKYVDDEFIARKHAETITGDGATTSFGISHGMNTRDVVVNVYDAATNKMVLTDVVADLNDVDIEFEIAPVTSKQYYVVVLS